MSSLAVTSSTNTLDIIFHSDESFTDKGFSAEYSAYDPSNRELQVSPLPHICVTSGEMGKMLGRDSDTHSLPLETKTREVTVQSERLRESGWLTV